MVNEQSNLIQTTPSPSVIIDRLGFGLFQVLLFIGFCLFFSTTVLAAGISGFIAFIIDKNWDCSALEIAFLGSCVLLGMSCGSFLSIALEPKFGRWKLILWTQPFVVVFSGLSALAPEFYTLALSRFIVTATVHISTSLGLSAFPEMVPSKHRGIFVSMTEFCSTFSSLSIWLYLYFFIPDLQGEGWRLMQLILCAIITLPMVTLCYFLIEESPVYLWQTQEPEKAVKALNRIASMNKQPLLTEAEVEAVFDCARGSRQELVRISNLFEGNYSTVTVILFLQWSVHNICFLGVLSTYPYFIGGDDLSASQTLTSYLIYVLSVFPAMAILAVIIDRPRIGRRGSLIVATTISITSLLIPIITEDETVIIICLAVFVASEQSMIILLSVFTLEIYETALRNSAMAYHNLGSRLLATLTVYGILVLVKFDFRLALVVLGIMQATSLVSLLWVKYETTGILLDGDTLASARRANQSEE